MTELENSGPARFVDSTGFKVEPITTCGVDWWYGYDEDGHSTGTPPDYDLLLILRLEGKTSVSRLIAFEAEGSQ
jgi:hypothetical protein